MYDELYAAWRLEIEHGELGSLPSNFYERLADYLRRIREDNTKIDQKTVRTTLLAHEENNVTRMTQELISERYRKMLKLTMSGRRVPVDSLAAEEQKLYGGVAPSTESFNQFAEDILKGHLAKIDAETVPMSQLQEHSVVNKRVTLRFLKSVPSIIGSDMKSYGPFLVEDVASVPVNNAKILVKQGLAKQVEF
jgi:DNA replication initiation complex subunit (GINS family)